MERRGLIVGGATVVVLALGLLLYHLGSSGEAGDPDHIARIGSGRERSGGGPSSLEGDGAGDRGSAEDERTARPGSGAEERARGDAGVRLRPVLPTPTEALETPGRTAPRREDMAVPESEHTAGWRLGQARRQIEMVEPRITHMQELARQLEERGDTAAAERQRRVIERFTSRLSELREDVATLEAEARQDGTIGEADRGYAETEAEASRPALVQGSDGIVVTPRPAP